jgi:hypothetical protein
MLRVAGRRYGVAGVAFAIALVWNRAGVTSGFECLLVFTLVYKGRLGCSNVGAPND